MNEADERYAMSVLQVANAAIRQAIAAVDMRVYSRETIRDIDLHLHLCALYSREAAYAENESLMRMWGACCNEEAEQVQQLVDQHVEEKHG
ncbi:MAG: hypothetical protein F4185_01070 [Chloroflexi bacterium]|nr:hypothetical protein [Chloroflexota bacterium]MYF64608.1 hypothetical protein [Chloroflexota bacterium]MYK33549.1 hypothetical protein [Chloroflexota bacterium]